MRKEVKSYFSLIFLVILIGFVLIQLMQPNFFNNIKQTITGRATSQGTNVSVTISGPNPAKVIYVTNISNTNPTEADAKAVDFNVYIMDKDGVSDLNDTSVAANFSKTFEILRQNSSCSWVNDINATTANYTCKIYMQYWDDAGMWNISVKAIDLGNLTWAYNSTVNFTYNQLKALVIKPASLTWPGIAPGATNQTSDNDPTIINNTGNYNGTIALTGIDLIGEIVNTERIFAGNFSVGVDAGGSPPEECNATKLVNNSAETITRSVSNRGNLSLLSGVGQEQFYYCINEVPIISSQTYSTTAGGSWTISY